MLCSESESMMSMLGFCGIYLKPLLSGLACKFLNFLRHAFYLVNFNDGSV